MTRKQTARYWAKQAFNLWHYNGIKKTGFVSVQGNETVPNGCVYVYRNEDCTVYMRDNGAIISIMELPR